MELLKEIEITLLPYSKLIAILLVLGVMNRLFKN
jgi:hypothetical protein